MAPEDEEAVVAELELLGIRYLSRHTREPVALLRPPDALIADLVRQPNARVRGAIIALFLAHPDHASEVSEALNHLSESEQWSLRVLYTAAMLLQQEHAEALHSHMATNWRWLPDLFSHDLEIPTKGTPRQRLIALGEWQRNHTRQVVNWVGTYENTVQHLLHSWKLKATWNH